MAERERPDYGVDAPGVIRNLFLVGGACLLLLLVVPKRVHLAANVVFLHVIRWLGRVAF